MTTARELGAVAIITVAVILTGCTASTAPTPTSSTAPSGKAPPVTVVAVDTAATPRGWVPVDFGLV
jgi:PBP1b-binding outer membrane lipoprotein LpoB